MLSPARTEDTVVGGVWLAVSTEFDGIIVSWTQHDASVGVLGLRVHDDIQREMRLTLYEILHTLGYHFRSYGAGEAYVVTGFRPRFLINDCHRGI